MPTPDVFDRLDAEEQDHEDGVTCRRCGAPDLHWQGVWTADGREQSALFEGTRRHACRASTDDFEDLS